ncbi:cytoplasmic protein [uncultured Nitratireductor sp.]|uniref:cytoplasmic protein n=1 Tax=uncultured Nitratireductor sp. TaxID=520953 RepID=UPI0025F04BB9|nr:cytoplasmic protein [uncultured Nitratireductor sp.]
MTAVKQESLTFLETKRQRREDARQTAALFLIGGMDLHKAEQCSGTERAGMLRRLKRLIERERLKGVRNHWSYDLNRHIALSQALKRLTSHPTQDNRAPSLNHDRRQ